MKPKTEAKALDTAVKALARATEKSWSSFTAEQQTEKLRDLKKLMASISKRRRRTNDSNQPV